ncbi:hypothetical protein HRbin27_01254 [bacterium HR27]|nr:hypothetical protein HRbin27_01254 [bacterium HR27]
MHGGLPFRARQFLGIHGILAQPGNLLVDDPLDHLWFSQWCQGRRNREQERIERERHAGGCRCAEAGSDERAVQPGTPAHATATECDRLPAGQDGVQHDERGHVGMGRLGYPPSHQELRSRCRSPHRHPSLGPLFRLADAEQRGRVATRESSEALLDRSERLVGIDVADDDEYRVGGLIVGAVVAVEVVARDLQEVLAIPDHRMPVGMRPECCGEYLFPQIRTRLVLAPGSLGEDNRTLTLDLGGIEARGNHSIRLDVERQLPARCRQCLEVRCVVQPGEAVERPAPAIHLAEDRARRKTRRSLEKHVLDPVGNAGQPRQLVPASHPVPDPARDHRHMPKGLDEDGQPVREARLERPVSVGHRRSRSRSDPAAQASARIRRRRTYGRIPPCR